MDLNNKFGWRDIEGWFGHSSIYDQIIREASKNDTIIEIGTWLGKSSCYLASRAKMSGKNIKIVCVDTFSSQNSLLEFNEHMTKAGVIDYVGSMIMNSELASYNVGKEAAFAVFIDNSETKDIRNWYPKIKQGGIIAGYNPSIDNSIKKILESIGTSDFKEDQNGMWLAHKPLVRPN